MAFAGLDLVPPGVVLVSERRPDDRGRSLPVRGELLRRRRVQAVALCARSRLRIARGDD